jgi:hypothetical protein
VAIVTIGIDVGQRRDPTAVCVVERLPPTGPQAADSYAVRWIERVPLGATYPTIVNRVALLSNQTQGLARSTPHLYVDATGVGAPFVDLLRAALPAFPLTPVFFVAGDHRTLTDRGELRLGKAWMVSRLQSLLQQGTLHLGHTSSAVELVDELLHYELRAGPESDRYGTFASHRHDDLVTALGLAVQPPVASHLNLLDYYRQSLP